MLFNYENDVNAAQKVISKIIKKNFFICRLEGSLTKITGSGSVSQRYGSADPDPYQNVTDPQHWHFV
jgi:hypothetical protein